MYAACTTGKRIVSAWAPVSVNIQKDGIGLRGDYEALISYGSYWQQVSSLCMNRNRLCIAHTSGAEVVALISLHTVRIIRAESATCLILRSVYTGDFYRATRCNFCRAKVATSFKHVRSPCDISATNRTENRTWFTRAILKLQL